MYTVDVKYFNYKLNSFLNINEMFSSIFYKKYEKFYLATFITYE